MIDKDKKIKQLGDEVAFLRLRLDTIKADLKYANDFIESQNSYIEEINDERTGTISKSLTEMPIKISYEYMQKFWPACAIAIIERQALEIESLKKNLPETIDK